MSTSFKERVEENHVNHPVLLKHRNVLEKLNDCRVACICYDKEKNIFSIMECCDEWFYLDLTKNDCIELSELFKDIAGAINT